jgi:hypothetical protein
MYVIINAPSNLGLRPTGVEGLPDVFMKEGFITKLNAKLVAEVQPKQSYQFPNGQIPKTVSKIQTVRVA